MDNKTNQRLNLYFMVFSLAKARMLLSLFGQDKLITWQEKVSSGYQSFLNSAGLKKEGSFCNSPLSVVIRVPLKQEEKGVLFAD